jgi:hypothetical protein
VGACVKTFFFSFGGAVEHKGVRVWRDGVQSKTPTFHASKKKHRAKKRVNPYSKEKT